MNRDRNTDSRPIKTARAVIFEEFLVLQELSALIEYTLSRQNDFRASEVYDPSHASDSHRRSRVNLDTGPFHDVICGRIAFYLPRILRALNRPYFDVSRTESQLTASNDGDYFRVHNDNTHANLPTREITYVYFFHREPRPFEGGDLALYDSRKGDGLVPRKRITPEQNMIVFFHSSCLHEILPVHCPSRAFADSRFTFNGWLHR